MKKTRNEEKKWGFRGSEKRRTEYFPAECVTNILGRVREKLCERVSVITFIQCERVLVSATFHLKVSVNDVFLVHSCDGEVNLGSI